MKIILLISTIALALAVLPMAFIISIRNDSNPYAPEFKSQILRFEVDKEVILKKIRTDAKILMFGDMIFEDPLYAMVKKGENPFINMIEEFGKYDLVVGNLETTIEGKAVGKPQSGKPFTFSAPKNLPQILKESGIDIVGYANNHTKDYGEKSVTHTIDLLKKAGIKSFGAGKNSNEAFKTLVVEVNGIKIGFFGINSAEYLYNISGVNSPGTAYFNEYLASNAVASGAKLCDVLIVYAHWGDERSSNANSFQKLWSRKFIDLGADVVVGSHPHVRQEVEEYKGKKIYYSLGNFIFPGVDYAESRIGSILEIRVDKNKAIKSTVRDIVINLQGVPKLKSK